MHLRRASLLGLIVAIFGAAMASQIVEIVFGYGRVGSEGIAMIARLFAIGVFALPFAGLALIGGNFLYATHRPRAAVLPAVGGLAATAGCALPALNLGDSRYLMVASVVGQAILALGMLARGGLLTRGAGAGSFAAVGSWIGRALAASIPLALALWLAVGSASAGSIAQLAISGSGLLAAGAIVVCGDSRDMTKRLFDVAVSACGLVLAAPVIAAIALAIFVRDGRPVIFRQVRVGRNARPFEILKFRTMLRDAQASGGISTAAGDARITPLGGFLRKTSLDELPQLINVLRGDMSLVGPRPDTPQQEQDYTASEWRARCSVRPGITGLAQATLRSSATPEQRLALDLQYASNPNLLRDLKILGKTFAQVIAKGGI